MLNILWVEDEYSEQKQSAWFNNRAVFVKTNFLEAKAAINNGLVQFDLIVLDINLENTEHSSEVNELAKQFKITEQEFLEESGMNLFLNLLEHGFPKEQIIFLTANADIKISRIDELREAHRQDNYDVFDEILGNITNELSEKVAIKCSELMEGENFEGLFQYLENYFNKLNNGVTNNTYNRFCEAYQRCRIEPPKAINKSLNEEAKHHLNHWLEDHDRNYYLLLRRGIIEGCDYLKFHIEKNASNIRFSDFIKKEINHEISTSDIKNYLDTLSQFLALKQPNDKLAENIQYRLFLRTLSHEWEENIDVNSLKQNHGNNLSKIRDIYTFAWLMKMTRNWTSHANLLEPLTPQIIAFLYLINMRAMFKLPETIQPYERILLNCISSSSVKNINNQELNEHINYAVQNIDGILASFNNNESVHFGQKINAIYRQNTGNPDAEEHDFKRFLLQYFWINQKSELKNLTATSDDFLPTLARHIYNISFSEA